MQSFVLLRIKRYFGGVLFLAALFICLSSPQAYASIALVQSTSTFIGGAPYTSITLPSAVTAGDFLAVVFRDGDDVTDGVSTTIYDTAGNTWHQAIAVDQAADNDEGITYYAMNAKGGADTITVSSTMDETVMWAATEWSGVATTSALDVTVATSSGATNVSTVQAGNVTTTNANDLILNGFLLGSSDSMTWTVDPSWTLLEDVGGRGFGDGARIVGSYRVVSSTIGYDATSTPGVSTEAAGWSTAFKAAVVPTPDTTPPQVTLVAPTAGSTVSSTVTISASSTDNVAVAGVQFQIDGTNLGSLITATSGGPTIYNTSWNTASSSDGTHIISAIAYDTSNNTSTATSSVTVSNASMSQPTSTPQSSSGGTVVGVAGSPGFSEFVTVSIESPRQGAIVQGTIPVLGMTSDDTEVSSFFFKLDGVELSSTFNAPPYTFTLDTTQLGPGNHTLQAYAENRFQNTAISNPVTFAVGAAVAPAAAVQPSVPTIPTSTPPLFPFTRNLTLGSNGPDILILQELLNRLGFTLAASGPGSPGQETEYFGPRTQHALINFQKSVGLPATGFFGPMTRAYLAGTGKP